MILVKFLTIFIIMVLLITERLDYVNGRMNRWERQRSKNLMSCYSFLLLASILIIIFE
ncbi:MAG: hypothetical protein ACRCU6_12220 [Fusobacteriaceae bacterium]